MRGFFREGDRNASGASPNIKRLNGTIPAAQPCQRLINQQLSFGSRDEHSGRNPKIEPVKFLTSCQISQRLTLSKALHQLGKDCGLLCVQACFGMRQYPGFWSFQYKSEQYQNAYVGIGYCGGQLS